MRNSWRLLLQKSVVLAVTFFGLTALLSGAPCVSGTLSSYVGLGSAGCTVDGALLSGFQVLTGTTGAIEISPLDVLLSPSFSASSVSLTTVANATSSTGMIQEVLFSYELSVNAFTGSAITLSASSESGDGAVTGLQNFCLNGVFGPDGVSGCTGTPGSLATVDDVINRDSASFAAASQLSVTNDLTIDGGTAGSARGGTLNNQFATSAAVPEPAPILLFGIGMALAAVRLFSIRSNKSCQ